LQTDADIAAFLTQESVIEEYSDDDCDLEDPSVHKSDEDEELENVKVRIWTKPGSRLLRLHHNQLPVLPHHYQDINGIRLIL
jgi:hypothetical protein